MSDSFATPWTGIFQARIQEWATISFLQGNLSDLALQAESLQPSQQGSPFYILLLLLLLLSRFSRVRLYETP